MRQPGIWSASKPRTKEAPPRRQGSGNSVGSDTDSIIPKRPRSSLGQWPCAWSASGEARRRQSERAKSKASRIPEFNCRRRGASLAGTISAPRTYYRNNAAGERAVILIKYGFDIEVQLFQRTTVLTAMDLHPSRRDDVVMESTFRAANASTSESFLDSFGNLCRRVVA